MDSILIYYKNLAKTLVICSFLSFFTNSNLKSQEVLLEYGVGYHFFSGDHLFEDFYGAIPAVYFNPRLCFLEIGESAGLSVGAIPALGLDLNFNSRGGLATGLLFQIPIMVEFNWGLGAYQDAYEGFGYFFGVGGDYSFNNYFGDSPLKNQVSPIITAGFRMRSFGANTIRFMYSPKLGNERYQALRISYGMIIGE